MFPKVLAREQVTDSGCSLGQWFSALAAPQGQQSLLGLNLWAHPKVPIQQASRGSWESGGSKDREGDLKAS